MRNINFHIVCFITNGMHGLAGAESILAAPQHLHITISHGTAKRCLMHTKYVVDTPVLHRSALCLQSD